MAGKTCFVTVGATASFNELVQAVLAHSFLQALQNKGYSELVVQYGHGGQSLYEKLLAEAGTSRLRISGFDLDTSGLGKYMRGAKAGDGVVISHAGSGTILDALRMAVPIIVVPNESLLDNHQTDLAEALAEQEYVVHGRISNLAAALEDAESLRARQLAWPPPNAGKERHVKGLRGVLDEEMGFLDGEIGALPPQTSVQKTADVTLLQTVIGD